MATINDNTALLLYRVGPVFCAAPCQPITAIIEPPALTRTPGSDGAQPGIFKYANAIVRGLDLRYKFGVEPAQWTQPGRTVITQLAQHHMGFYVDEILDVISMPTTGWGGLPALLPRGVFTRTLTLRDRIFLYADFKDLQRIPDSGYLRQYIQQLMQASQAEQHPAETPRRTTKPALASGSNSRAATTAKAAATESGKVERPLTPGSLSDKPTPVHTQQKKPTQTVRTKPAGTTTTVTADAFHPHASKQTVSRSSSSPLAASSNSKQDLHTEPGPALKRATQAPQAQQQPATGLPASTVATRQSPQNKTNRPAALFPSTSGPSESVTRATNQTEHNHTGRLIAGMLLVFILMAGGIWYFFRDETTTIAMQSDSPAAINDSIDAPIAMHDEQLATITDTATTPVTPPASTSPQKSAPTDVQQEMKPTAQTPPATVKQAASAKPPDDTNAAETKYHASIEKDAQGLTITLDVPEDDPSFTQDATENTTSENEVKSEQANDEQADVTSTEQTENIASHPTSTTPAKVQTMEIIHVVVKGDTLWAIAKRYVKNPFRYPELARLSKIKNPDLIYPGDRVRIIKRKHRP